MSSPDPKKTKVVDAKAEATAEEEGTLDLPEYAAAYEAQVERMFECQEELNKVDEAEEAAIVAVQKEYDEKRKPIFAKRAATAAEIPDFWAHSLENHNIGGYMTAEDVKVMAHLVDISYEDTADSLKFVFKFKQNPFFDAAQLVKEFRSLEDGSLEAVPFKIIWKRDKDVTKPTAATNPTSDAGKRSLEAQPSFFLWFGDASPFDDQEIVSLLKDLCHNPLGAFVGAVEEFDGEDSADDEDSEEEEGSEDEDEEK